MTARTLKWAWRELVRPRGPVKHRYYRGGRRSKAGVALLMAITAIMLLTILVTEIAHGAMVRVELAAQHRDDIKAEALAYSGWRSTAWCSSRRRPSGRTRCCRRPRRCSAGSPAAATRPSCGRRCRSSTRGCCACSSWPTAATASSRT
ncbi:MAG: hypothetical protein R3F59_11640 [Myxococcota bacterium]